MSNEKGFCRHIYYTFLFIFQTDGALCSFDEAIQQLVYYEQKQKRRMPWNCDLEISKLLQIKIAAYIYVSLTNAHQHFTLNLIYSRITFSNIPCQRFAKNRNQLNSRPADKADRKPKR